MGTQYLGFWPAFDPGGKVDVQKVFTTGHGRVVDVGAEYLNRCGMIGDLLAIEPHRIWNCQEKNQKIKALHIHALRLKK